MLEVLFNYFLEVLLEVFLEEDALVLVLQEELEEHDVLLLEEHLFEEEQLEDLLEEP